MIRLNQIEKIYHAGGVDTPALQGVSIEIVEGEFVAIMGTSGSGKTTLLNIIGGMDVPTGGEYRFDDVEVSALSRMQLHRFRKNHISFVFQDFSLIRQYTVAENAELPLIAKGIHGRTRRKTVEKALRAVGIYDLRDKLAVHLSGGQQQRCAIARAIASGNKLILADEPTGALDSRTSEEILSVFQELNRNGKTILLVTHDEHVARYADRILRLEDGRIVND